MKRKLLLSIFVLIFVVALCGAAAAAPNIVVTKTVDKNPVNPGDTITYSINIANTASNTLQNAAYNVHLTDDITPLENVQYSRDGGVIWLNWPPILGYVEVLGILGGGSRNILIRGDVPAGFSGNSFTNQAHVTYNYGISGSGSADSNTLTINVNQPTTTTLSITKTADPSPAVPGEQLTYTIDVTNIGSADALNTVLNDDVSAIFTGTPTYKIDGADQGDYSGIVNLGDIAASPGDDDREVKITGTMNPNYAGDNVVNDASVKADNSPTYQVEATTSIERHIAIDVSKSDDPDPVVAGNQLTYTIPIHNAGPSAAYDVHIDDPVPFLSDTSYSLDNGVTWTSFTSPLSLTIPDPIGVDQTTALLIKGTVPSNNNQGTNLVNMVTQTKPSNAVDEGTGPHIATVTTSVITRADLVVSKFAIPSPAKVFKPITYTVTVNNNGPSDAQNVKLKDILYPLLLNTKYRVNMGTWKPLWIGTYIPLGTIPANTKKTVEINGIPSIFAALLHNIRNTAVVTSTTKDPLPSSNTVTLNTRVIWN